MKTKSENLIDPNLLSFVFPAHGEDDSEGVYDPHFSRYPCQCCGDRKAGDRYSVIAVYRDQYGDKGRIEKMDSPDRCFSVCPDCVQSYQ
jgi:hypothetical protein